jgi:deoxyribonuclease V
MKHSWQVSQRAAAKIQLELRTEVITEDRFAIVNTVAGVDVSYPAQRACTRAAVVVLDINSLVQVDSALAQRETSFPYIPGLLSFRETPAILDAFARIGTHPDLLLCDGHGLAHPRRFGLACHIGVLLDIPSIGVAKSLLTGEHEQLDQQRGSCQPLLDGDQVIGAVVRTRTSVRPVYVSVGHRISLETAVEFVLQCSPRYRLPEPIRSAHRLASSKNDLHPPASG